MDRHNGNHHEEDSPTKLPVVADTGGTLAVPAGEQEAPKVNFFTVMRNAGFRNLWFGQIISQMGDYFSFLATTLVVSGFSEDPETITLMVSGMMIANSLPRLLFGMLSGVFVDRWDRRTTMLVADLIRVGIALAMVPAVMSQNLWAMYALGFALSTVGTLFLPAKSAIIPRLVPGEHLLSANALIQMTMFLAILLGPAFAGFTLSVVGEGNEWIAFIVDAASYLVSAFAIWMIRVPKEVSAPSRAALEVSQASAVRAVWDEMLVGIKLLFKNKTLSTLAVVFMVTMLGIGAVNVLWVVYLKETLGFDGSELAWRFSVLDICFAAGMIVASAIVGNFLTNLAPKWFIVAALMGAGIFLAPTGYITDYTVLAILTVGVGIFVAPINTGAATLTQIVVPNDQLGRANGGLSTITESATVLSMSLAGFAAALVGVPTVFLVGGILCFAGGVLAWLRLPALTLKDMPKDDYKGETPRDDSGTVEIEREREEAVA